MSSRSPRPRRRRGRPRSTGPSAPPPPPAQRTRFLLSAREATAAAFIASIVAVAVVTALIVSRGGSNDQPSTGRPSAFDEQAIELLARRSIETLPQGEWPSLYDSFTPEFQQRCARPDFEQAGRDASVELGDDLFTLRYKRLENLTVEGNTGQADIIGEVGGNTEYTVQAAFQKIEDGSWRIAPAPGTEGCAAFNRLTT